MAADTSTGRTATSRPVFLAGIALGTAITILAVWDGLRLNVPGVPAILRAVLGVLLLWALFGTLGAILSELTRRHHRAALRHGGRGVRAAYRGAARRSRPWRTRFLTVIQARWDARRPEIPAGSRPVDDLYDDEDLNMAVALSDHDPAPPAKGIVMTDTPTPAVPAPRSGGRRVLTIGGNVPVEWKNLVALTADFEPEDDAHLLAWMASEVNGMSAYAESLVEVYETGVGSLGLDPVSLAALHDYADSAAECAQVMAYARKKFASHYAEVREFAAAGGLLPHDGRWITGDGE
jgi:hypothetical protein